jgi:three-Cys-motif partner protein
MAVKYDKIGIWSEIKLDIVKEYASAYTKILSSKQWCKGHCYIDAFAGAGKHISRRTGELVPGSPLNALEVNPPFTDYYFIDMDSDRAKGLEELSEENPNIHVYHGDCNDILLRNVFPALGYNSFKRGLCLLDPYGLTLKWETIQAAGELKTLDILIHFPIMDINRNVLRADLSKAESEHIDRMNVFWGNKDWKEKLYCETIDLFGDTHTLKVEDFTCLAKAFREKLKKEAGFKFVPEPILMRNTTGGPLYYLFFASHQPVAEKIIKDIFMKHKGHIT